MFSKTIAFGALGLALIGTALAPAQSAAQDVPNLLVMVEDSDKDTLPRDSRVQRGIINGMNDRMTGRGYRVYDEQAVGIDGYRETTVSDRVRRTDQELIAVANSVNSPVIDIIVAYQVYASLDKQAYATFARMRVSGRMIDPQGGRALGSFDVTTPKTYKLPVNCSVECLKEQLSEEGRQMGIDLADVLADKLDQYFRPAGAVETGSVPVSEGGVAVASGGPGFERRYSLRFSECSQRTLTDFEPYLVIFEGYVDHRADRCTATRCDMSYISTINPGKLQRNLVKMLDHSNHPGRVTVSGLEYRVACVPTRKLSPVELNPNDW
ncbi:MAG: hypothetical protein AAF074_17800 [Pseudomonadota bacterium]